ncbi:MAG TPA: NAD(+) synthase [Gammaproteobacteria bacterium]|nr:NAD(+) synthase [Gammaproteobacteria bacterium]
MAIKLTDKILEIDYEAEADRISRRLREILSRSLKRRGLVVAMSGGIDSSVSAALAVRALGKKKVFGMLLPEQDSSDDSSNRGKILAEHLGIEYITQDIRETLSSIGCYEWRDNAIKKTFPEYTDGWKNKIVISGGAEGKYNHFKLVVQNPAGELMEKRLELKEYLQIVAATNYKQRIRKSIEYFHADRLNYAVVGTPNRLEYDQGFFVKNGDGAADVKPIAHLYKTQVYAMSRHLCLPEEICSAIPTTDTYSLQQGQDEFYFSLPYHKMDVALWALNHGVSVNELAQYLETGTDQAEFIYKDIQSKRVATHYMHSKAYLIDNQPELELSKALEK